MKILKILETGEGLTENHLLVPFVMEGEEVVVEKKGKKGFLKEVFKKSSERREARCQHFTVCGGCQWQHMNYEEQIRIKKNLLEEKFQHLVKWNQNILVHGSSEWFYRNKMELSFSEEGYDGTKKVLGLHPKGVFGKILDLQECYLFDPKMGKLLKKIRELTEKESYYHIKKQEGFLRTLVLRKMDSRWMILLVTTEKKLSWTKTFFEKLKESFPEIISCYLGINNKLNDSLWDIHFEKISGEDSLKKEGKVKLFVGAKSFFQPNELTHDKFFALVQDFVQAQDKDVLMDLYCGVGTLGLVSGVKKIIGLENNEEAVFLAKKNAEENKKDALYFCEMVEKTLEKRLQEFQVNKVIVDPPRMGLHNDVIDTLKKNFFVKELVYISCHPSTLLRDLVKLEEDFILEKVEALDQFPQTRHVEVFTKLKRKEK